MISENNLYQDHQLHYRHLKPKNIQNQSRYTFFFTFYKFTQQNYFDFINFQLKYKEYI